MSVKVYTTSTCPWCKKVKEFLDENGVKYKEINVGEDHKGAQEMIKKSGQTGVPVLDINGKIIIGFEEDEIRKALKKKAA